MRGANVDVFSVLISKLSKRNVCGRSRSLERKRLQSRDMSTRGESNAYSLISTNMTTTRKTEPGPTSMEIQASIGNLDTLPSITYSKAFGASQSHYETRRTFKKEERLRAIRNTKNAKVVLASYQRFFPLSSCFMFTLAQGPI